MKHHYSRHYTLEEAQALLPQVQGWLAHLRAAHRRMEKLGDHLGHLAVDDQDVGGSAVNTYYKVVVDVQVLLAEFGRREIVVKDVDRGLIDFPSFRGGREVFLCWEEGEETIEFWHDLDTGYAGREHL
jgi:hypothetical protein